MRYPHYRVPGFRGWYTTDPDWNNHPTIPLWPCWWNIRGMRQLWRQR